MSSKAENSKTDVSVRNADASMQDKSAASVAVAGSNADENSGEAASDALLDEALDILNGYEEGCAVKEVCGMSDCGCSTGSSNHGNLNDKTSQKNSHASFAPKLKE